MHSRDMTVYPLFVYPTRYIFHLDARTIYYRFPRMIVRVRHIYNIAIVTRHPFCIHIYYIVSLSSLQPSTFYPKRRHPASSLLAHSTFLAPPSKTNPPYSFDCRNNSTHPAIRTKKKEYKYNEWRSDDVNSRSIVVLIQKNWYRW